MNPELKKHYNSVSQTVVGGIMTGRMQDSTDGRTMLPEFKPIFHHTDTTLHDLRFPVSNFARCCDEYVTHLRVWLLKP